MLGALVAVLAVPLLGTPAASGSPGWRPPAADHWRGHGFDLANPAGCDPIDPAQCMLPYPNDWFTRPDPTSATGRRLDFTLLGMPRNVAGKPIDPSDYDRSDGFSAGAPILTYVPGLTRNSDLVPSGLPPVTDLAMNDSPGLGVVLLDTRTGRRVPAWVEVDQYTQEAGLLPAGTTGPVQHDLVIHPAANLADGHRYIVALRHLVTDDGRPAQPSAAFRAYRDGTAASRDPRTSHMNQIFATLERIGWSRSSLYLAWDFTTASTANVTSRLLAIRNDAFAQLGDSRLSDGKVEGRAPAFSVDHVADYSPAQDAQIARRITGHFTVPCYIAPTCSLPVKCDKVSASPFNDCPTPGQFLLGPAPDAKPVQVAGQTYQANFDCIVGRTAMDQRTKMRPVEYGHGLFGSASEVGSGSQRAMASRFGMLYCATDWFGMAAADIPNAVVALTDLSHFPWLADRVQQGELDFLYLARAMVHPEGFSSQPAFQWDDGTSFIDTREAYYDGNSQGGIYGGTVCAVSVDVRQCALGVPGMGYSVLLPRSSDYVAKQPLTATTPAQVIGGLGSPTDLIGYSDVFDLGYPDQAQRLLVLDIIQTLWDRADPQGYASHLTHGLAGTPSHRVLLQLAYGDHQVANITAEGEARTIGAGAVGPPLVAARYGQYHDMFWGIPQIASYPYAGSAIAIFDSGPASNRTPLGHLGTDPPPTADLPNRSGEDPHEAPRAAPCAQDQKAAFLDVGGTVTAPCGGPPYFSFGWNGTSGLQ